MNAGLQRFAEYERLFGPAGIGLALKAKFAKKPVEVETHPVGFKHPFSLRLKTSDLPTLQKVWRDEEYRFKGKAPKFIIDAGANIGIASVYFATKFPEAKIIAIEPEARNFTLLEKNTRPYENVICLRAALWKENGSVEITDPGQGPWSYRIGKGKALEQVEAVTVDEVLRRFGAEFIDLLKMDIEGAEKEVFAEPAAWIEKVGTIMVELHDRFKVGCSRNFYLATKDFPREEHRGETVILAR